MHDIVIVGAGPAGLFAARRCAEAGLNVLLVEEHAQVGEPTHCTGIVSLETADLVKIPEDIILNRLKRATLVSPEGHKSDVVWADEGKDQILVIDRRQFDRHLERDAIAAGASMQTGVRVQRIVVSPTGIELAAGGRRIQAKLALLACGICYGLPRQLGLELPRQVVHTAQVEVGAAHTDRVELHVGSQVAPGGFAWTTPIWRNGLPAMKIGVMTRGDASACLEAFLSRSAIRKHLRTPAAPPMRRLLPLGPAPKTYAARVMVLGDAAGLTKPTTGGGIFYSLLSASFAAETAVEACQAGRFDEVFLGRYQHRWRQRLGRELKMAQWFRGILTRCTDAEIDALVRAIGTAAVQDVIRSVARFNWHRELILTLMRRRGIISPLLRSLLA